MPHINGIESVRTLLKHGLASTYFNVNLPRYADEFFFRLNEGDYQIDTVNRMESLANGFGGKHITYNQLTQ